jgi:hypothetical protein
LVGAAVVARGVGLALGLAVALGLGLAAGPGLALADGGVPLSLVPALVPDKATGRSTDFVPAVLKLNNTTKPATVATNAATALRMSPPF